jgi:hypothetical protein
MKKQTAVEWLVEELNQKIDFIPMEKWDMIRNIVQQAKAMEKEQIRLVYEGILQNVGTSVKQSDLPTFEQYYKETFTEK